MKYLAVFVGPPGSGKSTLAKRYEKNGYFRINQDSQGKDGHLSLFLNALSQGLDIVVDRMNFNKEQRERYLSVAKKAGYKTQIVVFHESHDTCLERCIERSKYEGHETIKNEKHARSALQTFFTKYERPTKDEADEILFRYPTTAKKKAIICDLDGTLCNIEHRQHYVMNGKKDWKNFFKEIPNDKLNYQVDDVLQGFQKKGYSIVFCSGRDDNQRENTVRWLNKHDVQYDHLFMRSRHDCRKDSIIKEIILDFEILTRYDPYLILDDRDQVVKMWRDRGYMCWQVAPGDF